MDEVTTDAAFSDVFPELWIVEPVTFTVAVESAYRPTCQFVGLVGLIVFVAERSTLPAFSVADETLMPAALVTVMTPAVPDPPVWPFSAVRLRLPAGLPPFVRSIVADALTTICSA